MTRYNPAILLLLGTLASSPGFAQSGDLADELRRCAVVADSDARFACYDELGQRVLQDDVEPPLPPPPPEPVAAPQPLPDGEGLTSFEDDEEEDDVQYRGTITSCEEGRFGTWYFKFENGQVWKEVNKSSRRYRDCETTATITKDFFGYKMHIDGISRPVRVKRQE